MDRHLKKLENDSIYIFRQAYRSIDNIAMLWSLGKDSNVMVWLAFKAFFGKIPFPLVHVDTKKKNLKKCIHLEIDMKKNGT
jgi:sulfate adenylyltransferase subunit 2